ncbi:MAG TPA: HAD hydrolase family protein [Thermoleophilaceae bacterium]|nr:HAD hydrolase family protein [Thermoleophilaceae bacterium]
MSLRCVYTDLDGTLLGRGASLFHDADGSFTLLAGRALEACHRAGVEVVPISGRRRGQVAEPARLLGATAYCFEIGGGLVIDGEETWLCGEYQPRDGLTPWQLIDRSGAPALLLDTYTGVLEPHSPWHLGREVTHLFRGLVDVAEANALLVDNGHTGVRLLDNGTIDAQRRCYHLAPTTASKAAAVAAHMQARGYAATDCIAVGDSREDSEVAPAVGHLFLVANADPDLPAGPNTTRTEASHGAGFYEAVVQSLVA